MRFMRAGEMAVYAIKTAKDLTSRLRRDNGRWADFLFLVPKKERGAAKILSPFEMRYYINGDPGRDNGIMQRYQIPYERRVTPMDFRRRRATAQWMGGMQIREVAYDLGHVNSQSTVRHYILGDEEHKRRFIELVNHGALAGVLADFIGGHELVDARIGRYHVEIMDEQGMVVTPTRYGYCALHGSSGPRSRALPCYVGTHVDDEGCEWHILSPNALPALMEDKEVLEASIRMNEREPSRRQFVKNQRNQLEVVERRIEQATALKARGRKCGDDVVKCAGDAACPCESGRGGE